MPVEAVETMARIASFGSDGSKSREIFERLSALNSNAISFAVGQIAENNCRQH
jgi:hypothetical protein